MSIATADGAVVAIVKGGQCMALVVQVRQTSYWVIWLLVWWCIRLLVLT